MKYKVYLNELDDKSKELVNYSKNSINSKIDELSEIFNDTEWHGMAGEKYKLGYDKRIERLRKYGKNMEKLALYLVNSHNSYNDTNNELEKSWNSFIDEIKGDNSEM